MIYGSHFNDKSYEIDGLIKLYNFANDNNLISVETMIDFKFC